MQESKRLYRILLAGVISWCGLILLGPVLAAFHLPGASLCYRIFSHICHQDPARSFFLFGRQFTVCIRCTAIYFSFAAGMAYTPFLSRTFNISRRVLWVIASLPMIVDVFLDTTAVHQSNTVLRLLTGGFFGILAAVILKPLLIESFSELISLLHVQRIRHEPET